MKSILFRPLRRVKKTGKIVVSSYQQWRKVKTADYNKFMLTIDTEYKSLSSNDYVYNHKGEQLFWFDYHPSSIPVFNSGAIIDFDKILQENGHYAVDYGESKSYHARGLDCDGVPVFTHYTVNHISDYFKNMNQFEPLTVGKVIDLFGWFLYQLKNTDLTLK